ncbi:MAG: CBS domain-containing protein [Chitinophagales bacterium]
MIASEIISNHLKPLNYTDTGEMALLAMHELNVNQMPVVNNGVYVGIISLEEITLLKHLNDPLLEIHTSLKRPYVHESSHLFDVMKAALEYNVRIVPVLTDSDDVYAGVISAESCLKAFSELNSIVDEGGIIELTVPLKDFSLTEIVRIIESNGVYPLACYTNIDQMNSKVNITIKTNSNELSAIIATFERYNYEINGFYHEDEYREDMKDRYDALMRFINI